MPKHRRGKDVEDDARAPIAEAMTRHTGEAWLTEWERTRGKPVHDKLVTSMKTLAAQPRGFFTGSGKMNLNTGAFDISSDRKVSVSHLSAAFGLPEVCSELVELVSMPEFERAWLQYCELYNGSAEEQTHVLGEPLKGLNLQQGHARLTAFVPPTATTATMASHPA